MAATKPSRLASLSVNLPHQQQFAFIRATVICYWVYCNTRGRTTYSIGPTSVISHHVFSIVSCGSTCWTGIKYKTKPLTKSQQSRTSWFNLDFKNIHPDLQQLSTLTSKKCSTLTLRYFKYIYIPTHLKLATLRCHLGTSSWVSATGRNTSRAAWPSPRSTPRRPWPSWRIRRSSSLCLVMMFFFSQKKRWLILIKYCIYIYISILYIIYLYFKQNNVVFVALTVLKLAF